MGIHPLQHKRQFFIGKMMTKKGGENNIRLYRAKVNQFIIRGKQLLYSSRQTFTRYPYAIRVIVYACQLYGDIIFLAPAVNGQQVIAAAAANFTNRDRCFVCSIF